MIEKIYKKAIYALARVAVKYIELRKKREQKKKTTFKQADPTQLTIHLIRDILSIFNMPYNSPVYVHAIIKQPLHEATAATNADSNTPDDQYG